MDGIVKMAAGAMVALALALPAVAQVRTPPPGATAQPAQAQPSPLPAQPQPVQPPPTPQVPLEPTPVQPPPTPAVPLTPQPVQPAPVAPPAPLPAPPVEQRTQAAPDPNTTMAGRTGDSSDVDEVTLVAKPVLVLQGAATWDEGFRMLSQAQATLRAEAARVALPVAGRPLTLFVETDDNGFRFQAMLPVARAPDAGTALANAVTAGTTPAGASLRFVHQAPYDDIDSTYETITAYLEAKNITVKDAFLEEYVSDLKDPGDPNLMINVYVQPR